MGLLSIAKAVSKSLVVPALCTIGSIGLNYLESAMTGSDTCSVQQYSNELQSNQETQYYRTYSGGDKYYGGPLPDYQTISDEGIVLYRMMIYC